MKILVLDDERWRHDEYDRAMAGEGDARVSVSLKENGE